MECSLVPLVMWQLDVALPPFLPPKTDSLSSSIFSPLHPQPDFLLLSGGRGVDFPVSKDTVCSWTLPGMPLVLTLQTSPVWGSLQRVWNATHVCFKACERQV